MTDTRIDLGWFHPSRQSLLAARQWLTARRRLRRMRAARTRVVLATRRVIRR